MEVIGLPDKTIGMKAMLFFTVAGLAFLASCAQPPACGGTKEAFLKDYFALIEEATEAKLPVSDKGWKPYDERFRAYVEECYSLYEAEMSGKERRLFWSRSVKYYARRYGGGAIQELEQKKDRTAEKVKKEVEKIWENAGEALKEARGKEEKPGVVKKERPVETE